jgi:hypothetical protein
MPTLRDKLKEAIHTLPADPYHNTFKKMYAEGDMEMDIDTVIDNMPQDKLKWAITQIKQTHRKILRKL